MTPDHLTRRTIVLSIGLRLLGLLCIASGMVRGFVWAQDLADAGDGDDLRWGFWHNPLMQFRIFDEPLLLNSMRVLLVCAAASIVGGALLIALHRLGRRIVIWSAMIAIATHVLVCSIVAIKASGDVLWDWEKGAVMKRLGIVAFDLLVVLALWPKTVKRFVEQDRSNTTRGFDVIVPADESTV